MAGCLLSRRSLKFVPTIISSTIPHCRQSLSTTSTGQLVPPRLQQSLPFLRREVNRFNPETPIEEASTPPASW